MPYIAEQEELRNWKVSSYCCLSAQDNLTDTYRGEMMWVGIFTFYRSYSACIFSVHTKGAEDFYSKDYLAIVHVLGGVGGGELYIMKVSLRSCTFFQSGCLSVCLSVQIKFAAKKQSSTHVSRSYYFLIRHVLKKITKVIPFFKCCVTWLLPVTSCLFQADIIIVTL